MKTTYFARPLAYASIYWMRRLVEEWDGEGTNEALANKGRIRVAWSSMRDSAALWVHLSACYRAGHSRRGEGWDNLPLCTYIYPVEASWREKERKEKSQILRTMLHRQQTVSCRLSSKGLMIGLDRCFRINNEGCYDRLIPPLSCPVSVPSPRRILRSVAYIVPRLYMDTIEDAPACSPGLDHHFTKGRHRKHESSKIDIIILFA